MYSTNSNYYDAHKLLTKEVFSQKINYPLAISEEVIGHELERKNILDIGFNLDTDIKNWTKSHGGEYNFYDISDLTLKRHVEKFGLRIPENNSVPKITYRPIDITHTKFSLMHLSPPKRFNLIKEIISIAKEKSIFIAYDWSTFKGDATIKRFRDYAHAFVYEYADPFLGSRLKWEIDSATNDKYEIIEKRFRRQPHDFYREILSISEKIKLMVAETIPERYEEIFKLSEALKKKARQESPESFIPPDIVVVEVYKNSY